MRQVQYDTKCTMSICDVVTSLTQSNLPYLAASFSRSAVEWIVIASVSHKLHEFLERHRAHFASRPR